MNKEKKKIVILGGGFGGLYTYKGLYKYFEHDDIDITIVNRNNYFLFTPMLHEVATGGISHHQVVESIRQIIYKTNDKLHIAELESIDCINQKVKTTLGELKYDVLVVALGATTNFFNTPGAEEHALVLKDLRDAIKLRNLLIQKFEDASEMNEEDRKKELTFAVVGGGPTGVEIVTEMAELINDTLMKYYHGIIKCEDVTLSLINQSSEVLNPFHESLRKEALEVLKDSGVKVMLNTSVKEVRKDSVVLGDDSVLPVSTVVWTAGVKPNTPVFSSPIHLDKGGRVIVNSYLQIENYPNVFVLGDVASFALKPEDRPLPMLAQVAVSQGAHVGRNIKRLLEGGELAPFSFKLKGSLVSLGQWRAVADIYGFKFSGPLAWFVWRTIYLFKFLSKSKRIKIVVDWTVNIFYPRDITKA